MSSPTIDQVLALSVFKVMLLLQYYPKTLTGKSAITLAAKSGKDYLATLSHLDGVYISRGFLTAKDIADPFRQKYRHFAEMIAWALLRHTSSFYGRHWMRKLEPIPDADCARTFDQVARHLTSRNNLEDWNAKDEELLGVVELAMRILSGTLSRVKLREASAIVAAWTPVGIFISDELYQCIMGSELDAFVKWEVYREFYLKAIGLLKEMKKKGFANSGRELERIVYALHHDRD